MTRYLSLHRFRPQRTALRQPLSAAMPPNIVPVVLDSSLCMQNDLPEGASIFPGGIVKIQSRRAVACKVSGVKGCEKCCFCGCS